MKNLFKKIVVSLLIISFFYGLSAQIALENQLLPVDSKVRIGKLENGFTYYIRTNQKPENRIEMRLAVNAGSILETDNQQGLAHFVEHMCFNGSENFEKNELIHYIQSIGMRFGADLNAYTSFDQTVYMLTIPSDSTNLIDKGFLVMEDWAHNVTFDSSEIDKERGVIIEEWRLGQGASQRMRDKYLPVAFKNSHYADRLPIGKKDIIENAPYDTLRIFYRDWYRPDMMALIVVGNIDPDSAEAKIKEHFLPMVMPANPKERKQFDMPDQDKTLVSIVTDKEAPYSMVSIIYKDDVRAEITYADYLQMLKYSFLTGMLNNRLEDLIESEDPPFIGAGFGYGSFGARTKNALQGGAVVGEKGIERGLQTLLAEIKRLDEFGFTQGELDRFKLNLLQYYEHIYNERDKTESGNLADEYIRNFLEQEPVPGIEFEYEFIKNHINLIGLDELNTLAKSLIRNENRVIIITAPDKESVIVPSEDKVFEIAAMVDKIEVEPYGDSQTNNQLMNELPSPGKIKKEKKLENIEALDLTLSNGVRIILKPTDFKNDEVLLTAISKGGHSVYADSDFYSAIYADAIINESGVGDFSPSDLRKVLAGKTVNVSPEIGYYTESMVAQCKVSDIETMFQLFNLYFTQPKKDISAFNSFITKEKDLFMNVLEDPQYYFTDQYYRFKARNHSRGAYIPKPEDFDKINFDRVFEIYNDRYADADNFTFIMLGSFSIDSIKPLINRYIGSLPSTKRTESFKDLGIRPPGSKTVKNIYKGSDPKSIAMVYFEEEKAWNEKDAFMISVLSDILGFRYIDILREAMSGVYTVSAKASLQKIPYNFASLQLKIPCSPDNVDSLVYVAINELKKIQTVGVDEAEVQKAKETKRRSLENAAKTNGFWMAAIQNAILNNISLTEVTGEKYINQITSGEIQRVANNYFDADSYLEVVLYPENYK